MRSAPHWHQLSPARRDRERERLANTPYFTLERTSTNDRFTAIGTLHFIRRGGKEYRFRIRLEYPRHYPKRPPHVFDHDHQFAPSLDGHLFSTHEICLTLPERREFSTVSEQLTQEVLGATLVWFHKRLLFDRNGT
jgi:ubiquitin-protein ligase